jgi:hypothetical protein
MLDQQLWRRGNGGAETGSTPVPPLQHVDMCVSGALLCRIFRPYSRDTVGGHQQYLQRVHERIRFRSNLAWGKP